MDATNPELEVTEAKLKPKKRGRKSKQTQERNMRRMIEDRLEEMRLKRNMADYCFDD